MKHCAWFIAYAVCLFSTAAIAVDQILTFAGLGPVQIGMSVADAEKALGTKLKPLNPKDGVSTEACWLTERADGTQRGLTYMVRDGKIVRIDIWEDAADASGVTTEKGIRVGAAEDAVMSAYGSALEATEHPHVGKDGRYLMIAAPDKRHGLIFETVNGRVVNLRGGEIDSVTLEETCA